MKDKDKDKDKDYVEYNIHIDVDYIDGDLFLKKSPWYFKQKSEVVEEAERIIAEIKKSKRNAQVTFCLQLVLDTSFLSEVRKLINLGEYTDMQGEYPAWIKKIFAVRKLRFQEGRISADSGWSDHSLHCIIDDLSWQWWMY